MKLAVVFAGTMLSPWVSAFEDLKPAQKLIYDRSHLLNTQADQVLQYSFTLNGKEIESIDDTVTVNVKNKIDETRRDVSVEFLSGEQHMPLPDFDAYRGNPVIIAMLEHSAKLVGTESGGGTLYFRNRIRDRMADDIEVQTGEADFDGSTIATESITFKPFVGDANLASMSLKQLENMVYTITLSDDVLGGVVEIKIESHDDSGEPLLSNALTFIGVKTD